MEHRYKIRIQRGILMPEVKPRGLKGASPPIYPWREMKVGDSFLFPDRIGRMSHAAAIRASVEGRKYRVAKTDEGYRCWRVA